MDNLKLYKKCMVLLIFLLLASCTPPRTPYIVLLTNNQSHIFAPPNPNLHITVAEKFEDTQMIGGNVDSREVQFKEIVPWIKTQLFTVNKLNCELKKKVNLKIAINKLYINLDTEVLFGAILLNAELTTNNGETIIKNYHGDCKESFFSLRSREAEIKYCLNKSIKPIIENLKQDICEI